MYKNIIDYMNGIDEINQLMRILTAPFNYNSQEALNTRANQVKTLLDFASSTKANSILLKNKLAPIN